MINQTISHYRITGQLGSGGMGAVYKAEHLLMERPVALKVLNRELLTRFRMFHAMAAVPQELPIVHYHFREFDLVG